MRAIPAMAHDAMSLPYVTRVLGQLCPPGEAASGSVCLPDMSRIVLVSSSSNCSL